MKKRTTLVAVVLLALSASAAVAEPMEDKWLFAPNVGYVTMTSNDDDKAFNGVSLNGTIERIAPGGFYALGFYLCYISAVD